MISQNKFSLWRLIAIHLLLGATVFAQQSPAHYTISGHVQDGYGHSTAGVWVCAFASKIAPGEGVQCNWTNAQGQFTIRPSKPSRYRVIASKDEDGYMGQAMPFYQHPSVSVPEVTLDAANPDATVAVVLAPKNGVLVIKATDAKTQRPVENFRVILCRTDLANACFGLSGKNAEGRMKVFASHAPFTLRITAEGYEDWLGLNGAAKMPVSVASGETLEAEVYLRRRDDAFNQPLSESEKQVGVNLPAPAQLSPADGATFDHYPRKTKLEWAAVDGAASYIVEVDYCRGLVKGKTDCINPQPHGPGNMPPMKGIQQTSYEFSFVGAQPGRWRVWAIDQEGREGFKSPWRVFVYSR
jgi:hypothetical protein